MKIIQEDLEYRSVALAIKAAKITQEVLAKAMRAVLSKGKGAQGYGADANALEEGKHSIKELAKGGATLSNIEITEGNIKSFDPIARKYGVSYALQKDSASEPPKWMVFFRAKDVDAMTAAFKEYSSKTLKKRKDKPSVREEMARGKEKSRNAVRDKIKNKRRGEPEL